MPIASCQKIIINFMDTPETSHLEKVNFNSNFLGDLSFVEKSYRALLYRGCGAWPT